MVYGKTFCILLGAITFASNAGESPSLPSPKLIELGLGVYQKHCASCHGEKGEGAPDWKQPNDQGELPPPPHGPEGHTWRHADAMLYRMIAQGWRDPFNKTLRLTMPGFEDMLSKKEIDAVIVYLKTLWTPEQRRFQSEETKKRNGEHSH